MPTERQINGDYTGYRATVCFDRMNILRTCREDWNKFHRLSVQTVNFLDLHCANASAVLHATRVASDREDASEKTHTTCVRIFLLVTGPPKIQTPRRV